MTLPEPGDLNWGSPLNDAILAAQADAASAKADASSARSTAIDAHSTAQSVKEFVEAPTDEQIAAKVAEVASASQGAVDARVDAKVDPIRDLSDETFAANLSASTAGIVAPLGSAAARLLAKLRRGTTDASLMVIGDSTASNLQYEHKRQWVYQTARWLAAQFPEFTVIYHVWDPNTNAYDNAAGSWGGAVTIQTGTGTGNGGGPFTLHVWNFSAGGKSTQYPLGSYWASSGPAAKSADLVIINHGHNEAQYNGAIGTVIGQGITSATLATWRSQMAALTEQVAVDCPGAGVAIVLQNPQGSTSASATYPTVVQQQRAQAYTELAAERGYGVIDAQAKFLALGGPSDWDDYLDADGVHPVVYTSDDGTAPANCGQKLIFDAVTETIAADARMAPRPQPPAPLNEAAESLILNGDFSDWDDTVPTGWTIGGSNPGTIEKDATLYESANGYSAKLSQTAAYSTLEQELPLEKVKGQWITATARVYYDASQGSNSARLDIIDGDGVMRGRPNSSGAGADGWHWVVMSKRISSSSTSVKVALNVNTTAATGEINVDRIDVTLGAIPRRGVQPAAIGPAGTPGAAGDPTADFLDYWSTMGNGKPALAAFAGFASSVIGGVANRRIDVLVKAPRAGTITGLGWVPTALGTGDYDIGLIDDTSGAILWSKGTTSMSTLTVNQVNVETVSPGVDVDAGDLFRVALVFSGTDGTCRGLAAAVKDMLLLADGTGFAFSKSAAGPPLVAGLATSTVGQVPFVTLRVT